MIIPLLGLGGSLGGRQAAAAGPLRRAAAGARRGGGPGTRPAARAAPWRARGPCGPGWDTDTLTPLYMTLFECDFILSFNITRLSYTQRCIFQSESFASKSKILNYTLPEPGIEPAHLAVVLATTRSTK